MPERPGVNPDAENLTPPPAAETGADVPEVNQAEAGGEQGNEDREAEADPLKAKVVEAKQKFEAAKTVFEKKKKERGLFASLREKFPSVFGKKEKKKNEAAPQEEAQQREAGSTEAPQGEAQPAEEAGSVEEKSNIQQEFEAAREALEGAKTEYARAKAELVASKLPEFFKDQDQTVDAYAKIIAQGLEKKGGKASEVLEKIYKGYKKLGDLNVGKIGGLEEKIAQWQPTSKVGKIGKITANLITRGLSVRTAISIGLFVGAGAAAGGFEAAKMGMGFLGRPEVLSTIGNLGAGYIAAMTGRRALAGLGAGFATHDMMQARESGKLMNEVSADKITKMSNEDLVKRLREIEASQLLDGKEEITGAGHAQVVAEMEKRIAAGDMVENPTESSNEPATEGGAERTTEQGSETGTEAERAHAEIMSGSAAEIAAEVKSEKVGAKLGDLLKDTDAQLQGALASLQKSSRNRKIAAVGVGVFFSSGAFYEAMRGVGLIKETPNTLEDAQKISQEALQQLDSLKQTGESLKGSALSLIDQMQSGFEKAGKAMAKGLKETVEMKADHAKGLASIAKGEGFWSPVKRQLVDLVASHKGDPDFLGKLGFKGDPENAKQISAWAEAATAKLAQKPIMVEEGGKLVEKGAKWWDAQTGVSKGTTFVEGKPTQIYVDVGVDGKMSTHVEHLTKLIEQHPPVKIDTTVEEPATLGLKIGRVFAKQVAGVVDSHADYASRVGSLHGLMDSADNRVLVDGVEFLRGGSHAGDPLYYIVPGADDRGIVTPDVFKHLDSLKLPKFESLQNPDELAGVTAKGAKKVAKVAGRGIGQAVEQHGHHAAEGAVKGARKVAAEAVTQHGHEAVKKGAKVAGKAAGRSVAEVHTQEVAETFVKGAKVKIENGSISGMEDVTDTVREDIKGSVSGFEELLKQRGLTLKNLDVTMGKGYLGPTAKASIKVVDQQGHEWFFALAGVTKKDDQMAAIKDAFTATRLDKMLKLGSIPILGK